MIYTYVLYILGDKHRTAEKYISRKSTWPASTWAWPQSHVDLLGIGSEHTSIFSSTSLPLMASTSFNAVRRWTWGEPYIKTGQDDRKLNIFWQNLLNLIIYINPDVEFTSDFHFNRATLYCVASPCYHIDSFTNILSLIVVACTINY